MWSGASPSYGKQRPYCCHESRQPVNAVPMRRRPSHFTYAARIRLDAVFRDRCIGRSKGGRWLATTTT